MRLRSTVRKIKKEEEEPQEPAKPANQPSTGAGEDASSSSSSSSGESGEDYKSGGGSPAKEAVPTRRRITRSMSRSMTPAQVEVEGARLPAAGAKRALTPKLEGPRRHQKTKIEDPWIHPEEVRPSDVQKYLRSVLASRKDFYERAIAENGPPRLFMGGTRQWEVVNEIREPLRKWIGTKSIEFTVSSTSPPVRSSPPKKPRGRPPKKAPKVEVPSMPEPAAPSAPAAPMESFRVPIFESLSHSFQLDQAGVKPKFRSLHLSEIYETVTSVDASSSKSAPDGNDAIKHKSQILFCGGPISAIQTSPQRLANGDELVLISSFSDERMLGLGSEGEASYVQFWTFPSDLSQDARLKFLLEIPSVGAVLSIRWCPSFNEEMVKHWHQSGVEEESTPSIRRKSQFRRSIAQTPEGMLGYVAIATDVGKIFIHCDFSIPRDLDELLSSLHDTTRMEVDVPIVLCASPVLVLEHPEVVVHLPNDPRDSEMKRRQSKVRVKREEPPADTVGEGDDDEDEAKCGEEEAPEATHRATVIVDKGPLIGMDWSPFDGSKHIAAISMSGHVFVWSLEDPTHPAVLHSEEWNSSPASVSWIRKGIVCVSFRNRAVVKLMDVDTGQCVFQDTTQRVIGRMVNTSPSIFPGFFTYDTTMAAAKSTGRVDDGIQHTCSNYIVPTVIDARVKCEDKEEGEEQTREEAVLSVPLFNQHQIQAFHSCVCPLTGVIASVGADGRLVQSICTAIEPRSPATTANGGADADGDKRPKFTSAGTSLQVLTKRRRADDNKTCYSHADCCENRRLEVFVGNAANHHKVEGRKWSQRMPDGYIDRRLESLTVLDVSKVTPALSVLGGESGLVFIIPSML